VSFHQLREYKDGDILSQVDWKATARRGHLISRQYTASSAIRRSFYCWIVVAGCAPRMARPRSLTSV
jgi:uncharacterized protein (DUF58 family)